MQAPTEEDLQQLERRFGESISFLKQEGWGTDNDCVFSHPETGEECPWDKAEHLAVSKCVYRDGWFPVIIQTDYPKLKPDAPMRTRSEKEREFCYYSHPKHNRLFLFADLMGCYIHGDKIEETISLVAKRYAKMETLKDLTYVEGMWLKVHMWVEDDRPAEDRAQYELVEIGDWRKRDKLC